MFCTTCVRASKGVQRVACDPDGIALAGAAVGIDCCTDGVGLIDLDKAAKAVEVAHGVICRPDQWRE